MSHITRQLVAVAILVSPSAQAAPLQIDYTVAPLPSQQGGAATRVSILLRGLKEEKSVKLQMAVWSPGDYHVMDHAKYVRDFRAQFPPVTGGKSSVVDPKVSRPDTNTWEVPLEGQDSVLVSYTVPNTPPGYFSENVRVERNFGFYNGPATYMYVVGRKAEPVRLHLDLPEGWTSSFTALPKMEGHPHSYSAPDFDTLADSPVVAGEIVTRTFTAVGRPHTLVFFNRHRGTDFDAHVPVLRKIVEEQTRLMGGAPYERFGFFFDMGGRGGGLEHLNSFRVAWQGGFAPEAAAGFLAHEFFHLWNVKRIRPDVLGPFDYVNPPRTRNLWFSEGVTDYYGSMSIHRAGFVSEQELYEMFAAEIASLQSNPSRLRVSADESSLRVWEANNSTGYGGLSYYEKGKLIGLCLDLKLRAVTGGKSSLDHVMRDLMARHGLPKPGFPEDGIRDAVVRAGGASMGPFYDLLCRRTEEMPFAECFAGIGLRLTGGRGAPYRISVDAASGAGSTALRRGWLAGSAPEK